MKRFVALILTGLMLLSLVACGNSSTDESSDEPVTLTIAFPGQDVDQGAFDKVIAEFYKTYPNIKVEAIAVPNTSWADYISKIKTMVVGGKAPDVIRIAVQGISELVDNGMALEMDQYLEEYPELVDASLYYPQELYDYFKVNDKYYGLVWDANNIVMHINKKLVEEAGLTLPDDNWTKEEFIEFGQALTKEKDGQKQYAYAMPHNYFAMSAWLFNNGASFFNEDMTECTINSPEAVETFQFMQDLIYKYKIAPQPTPESNYTNQFLSEQVAMITCGRWNQATYQQNNMDTIALRLVPAMKDQVMVYGGGCYSMLSSTEHPDEAFLLASFMSGEFSQANYLDGGSIPSIRKVAEEAVPVTEPVPENYQLFIESPVPVKVVESPAQYSAIEGVFNRYYSQLLANEIDGQTAADMMYEEMSAIIKG